MTQQSQSKQPDEIFCSSCRAIIKRAADICVHCGVRVRGPQRAGYKSQAGSQVGSGLNVGAIIAAGAGIVLFIATFLPWYSVSIEFFGESISADANGWDAPGAGWSIAAGTMGLATLPPVLLMLLTRRGSPWTVAWALALLLVSAGALVLTLIKLTEESSHLAYGFYIAITAAATVAAGALLASLLAFVRFLAADEARRLR